MDDTLLTTDSPAGEPVAIADFLTDGSVAGLCRALSDATGAIVSLHEWHGGEIEWFDGEPPWRIHEPGPGADLLAEAIRAAQPATWTTLPDGRRLVPLQIEGRPMGGIVVDASGLRPGSCGASLDRIVELLASTIDEFCDNEAMLRRRNAELALLFRLSTLLVTIHELDRLLEIALASALRILQVDAGIVQLLGEEGANLDLRAASGLPDGFATRFARLPLDGASATPERLVNLGSAELREAAAAAGLAGMVSCALVFQNRVHGVIRLFTRRESLVDPAQQALMQTLAEQVSAAVESATVVDERRRARQLRRHLRLARNVQRRMLPEDLPEHPTLDIAARYVPCFELGGDFYDLFDVGGRFAVVIGDVVGKGVPAALLMASVRSLFRAHATTARTADEVVRRVNRSLAADTMPNEFATAFFALLDPDSLEVSFCNAGHDPPLLVSSEGDVLELSVGGPLLGVDANWEYACERMTLHPRDTVVAYTDGVTDAMNFDEQTFGRARFRASVLDELAANAAAPARALADRVIWDMRRYVGLNAETDDVTVVVLRAR